MFRRLLVPTLISLALSIRSVTKATVSLHAPHKTTCALICHLPPPFALWHQFLDDMCDLSTSLFIDSDTSPLQLLERADLSALDVVKAAKFLTVHYGDRYQILRTDLDVVQGVLFGQVLERHEIEKQNKFVIKPWTYEVGRYTRCIAFHALNEIAMLYKNTPLPDPEEYKKRSMRCLVGDPEVVSHEQVELARIEAEKALPRTKMLARYGGRNELLRKLAAALPPASETCGSPEECLRSQLVDVATWNPPASLENLYEKVIFVGCSYRSFQGRAVESALKLVAHGGEIIVHGYTPEDLEKLFGIRPFERLSFRWQRRPHENLTVFYERIKRRKLAH